MSRETDEDVLLTTQLQAWQSGVEPIPGDPADSISAAAIALEAQGWRAWLMTLFPFVFDESFSAEHIAFWGKRWSVLMRLREQIRCAKAKIDHAPQFAIEADEWATLFPLGRGLGKSATVEVAKVMRGALLVSGYCLYISEGQDQANEHIGNIRGLIDHPDSRLVEFYPHMAVEDDAVVYGIKTKDRADIFITKGGWVCRAKGLDSRMRGLRVGPMRPDDVALDDIDGVNDSIAVSEKKLRQIKSSILPTLARRFGTVDFPQNPIGEHSCANQILTGKSDVLAARQEIGPTATFRTFEEGVDYEVYYDERGRIRYRILPEAEPTWSGVDIPAAQKFLDNSGLDGFLSEYMNRFDMRQAGKMIPEHNEERQVITWSQFKAVFKQSRIPAHWKSKVGLDIGYSTGLHPHYSAWGFVATAANNEPLAGAKFFYRFRTFTGTSIDDQQADVVADMYPDEYSMIETWEMSHERTGEMLTLKQKYKLPFRKFSYFAAEDGVAQWRHLSKPDKTQPHPFKEDYQNPDGTWKIGRCQLYFIVADDQLALPRDDGGMRVTRRQISNWERVPVKLVESGQTAEKPSKTDEDSCDVIKSLLAHFGPQATPLTPRETVIAELSSTVQQQIKNPRPLTAQEELRQQLELMRAQKKVGYNISTGMYADTDEWAGYEYE